MYKCYTSVSQRPSCVGLRTRQHLLFDLKYPLDAKIVTTALSEISSSRVSMDRRLSTCWLNVQGRTCHRRELAESSKLGHYA